MKTANTAKQPNEEHSIMAIEGVTLGPVGLFLEEATTVARKADEVKSTDSLIRT